MAFVHNGFCYMAVLQVRPVIPSESSKFRLGRLVKNISSLQSVFTESVLKEFRNIKGTLKTLRYCTLMNISSLQSVFTESVLKEFRNIKGTLKTLRYCALMNRQVDCWFLTLHNNELNKLATDYY